MWLSKTTSAAAQAHALVYLLGLLILCSVSAAWCALSCSFYASFPSLFAGAFVSHFETRWCYISMTSEARTRWLHINCTKHLRTRLWDCREIFNFFTTRVLLFNIFMVRRMNTYIQTYIHTDSACVQHVNVGLAQAQANYDCMYV